MRRIHWLVVALGGAIGLWLYSRTPKGADAISRIVGGGVSKLLEFVAREEGERLDVYQDVAMIWTVGVGHVVLASDTVLRDGVRVKLHPFGPVRRITRDESREFLRRDLEIATRGVDDNVKVLLTSNQRAALISLVFNIGVKAFRESTLLRFLNDKQFAAAADQFGRWVKTGTVTQPGLVARRERERALFLQVAA